MSASLALVRTTLLGALIGVTLVGCGSAKDATGAGRQTTTSPTSSSTGAHAAEPERLRARISYPGGAHSPRFALYDQHQQLVATTKLAGRPYVLLFLSTRCSVGCQGSLARIATAIHQRSIRVVLVSTTPSIDTPSATLALLRKTHLDRPSVTYSSRPAKNLTRLLRAGHYAAAPVRILRTRLIDKHGKLRAEYIGGFNPADLAHDAAVLVDE